MRVSLSVILTVATLLYCRDEAEATRLYSAQKIAALREEVRQMFQDAYQSYLSYAYPYDELRPLSCDGVDTWGSYSLTLVDALDTLLIMGNTTEFDRVVQIVTERDNFDANINVSVFETNIRLIGGLLSAHLLSHKSGAKLEPGWPCNGPLLRLAEDAAQRLIAAFDTPTGMPYGTVNLRYGVPRGETSVTCTAGIGTFIIEFGTLSRLTGDPLYEEIALHALDALYNHRSPIGLLGNHVDVQTGRWVAQDAGIGAGVDSYYEYLVKGAILLQKPELMDMFHEARTTIDKYLKKDDWYVWASMTKGQVTLPVFQSLEAFWPGVLSLIGDTDAAVRIIHNYHTVWKKYGFIPEVYNIGAAGASSGRESYPLRPELIESIMYLYRDTKDPIFLQMGEDILRSIQHSSKTTCGYATIKDVRDHRKEDRMESFFLAETTKYLYLLFDPDNFIHNPGLKGTVIDTPYGECIIDVGGYIFNTEAHPIDPAALHCCHSANKGIDLEQVDNFYKIFQNEVNYNWYQPRKTFEEPIKNLTSQVTLNTSLNTNNDQEEDDAVNKISQFMSVKQKENVTSSVETVGLNLNEMNTDKEAFDPKEETILAIDEVDGKQSYQHNESENFTDKEKDSKPIPPPLGQERSKSAVSLLPDFVQDLFINSVSGKKKCEPQSMLERIRNEKLYSKHPMKNEFHILQTSAPSFLHRISLLGEIMSEN